MSITLNTKTYNWAGWLATGIGMYREVSGGFAAAFSILTGRVEVSDKTAKVSWKLRLPVVQTAGDACACPGDVIRDAVVDIVVRLSPKLSAAERTDFGLRIKDLAASPEFQASIASLTQPSA